MCGGMSRYSVVSSRNRDRERRSTLGKAGKSATLDGGHAGGAAVLCDICTGNKRRAAKTCLACLASFCEAHLQQHYEYPALTKHKLVEPAGRLQEKICSNHDKLLEVYCRTDQQCVCLLCMMEEHKSHETVSAATERTERQVRDRALGHRYGTGLWDTGTGQGSGTQVRDRALGHR